MPSDRRSPSRAEGPPVTRVTNSSPSLKRGRVSREVVQAVLDEVRDSLGPSVTAARLDEISATYEAVTGIRPTAAMRRFLAFAIRRHGPDCGALIRDLYAARGSAENLILAALKHDIRDEAWWRRRRR